MTDYSSCSINESTSSSDAISSRTTTNSRMRIVRLCRPNSSSSRRILIGSQNTSFGFAIRGGREFNIGFFVSRIEKGSEADLKGLKVGDQIIRVNGYLVDNAVHKELSQFISNQDRLTLKVRGFGMLPVKDQPTDLITWHIVPSRIPLLVNREDDNTICQDVRIVLTIIPRTKLGLGICKGPDWKPGIFVQFTKEGSVARDAGLRPGDQLLCCNNIDFTDILFSEAVAIMKSSNVLELIVRTSAGIDLFPGESSGYNSSASSVTGGDQSPCWADQSSKRLSIVKEEDTIDRIGYLRSNRWDKKSIDRRKDFQYNDDELQYYPDHLYDSHKHISVGGISNNNNYSNKINQNHMLHNNNNSNYNAKELNTTIIKLTETETVINNTIIPNIKPINQNKNNGGSVQQSTTVHLENGGNVTIKENNRITNYTTANTINNMGDNQRQHHQHPPLERHGGQQLADVRFVSKQSEVKTVIVEVHRNGAATATTNTDDQKSSAVLPPPPPPTNLFEPNFNSSMNNKNNTYSSTNSSFDGSSLCSAISDEIKKRAARTPQSCSKMNELNGTVLQNTNPLSMTKKLGSSLVSDDQNSEKHNALMNEFKKAHQKMFKNGFTTDPDNKEHQERQIAKKVNNAGTDVTDVMAKNGHHLQNPKCKPDSPKLPIGITTKLPAIPTPDYDSTSSANSTINKYPKSMNNINLKTIPDTPSQSISNPSLSKTKFNSTEITKANGDAAEMESIDSFQLANPYSPTPKPPSMYFNPQSSGPPTMKKKYRPVSVTIGEYDAGNRKDPNKFDFIEKCPDEHNGGGGGGGGGGGNDVTDRLRTELQKTLSRSNLKSKNEHEESSNTNKSIININSNPNQISNSNNIIKTGLHKTESNIEKITAMLASHHLLQQRNQENGNQSVKLPIKPDLRKVESMPNGILKSSGGATSPNGHSEHKNISFSHVTTVLSDR